MLAVANPSLAAEKTITVSGDSVPSDCAAAKSPSGGASKLKGSLEGCLAIFIQNENCRPLNGFDYYVQLGHEEFEGKLEGKDVKFDTIFTFNAVWPSGSCPTPGPEKEMAGSCTHYVSGKGLQGVIRFYDIIPSVGKGASNFLYEGVLTVGDAPVARADPAAPAPYRLAEAVVPSAKTGLQGTIC
jgi:hypothetical protein